MTNPATGEIAVPYGMAVWSTGIGTRPIIMDFMKQVGQVYLVFCSPPFTSEKCPCTHQVQYQHDSCRGIGVC